MSLFYDFDNLISYCKIKKKFCYKRVWEKLFQEQQKRR